MNRLPNTSDGTPRHTASILLFATAVAIGALFVLHAVHLQVVAEDAFISFRYAAHLATGHGLVWNPGEAPVEGYTNFLWVLISALMIAAGRDVALSAQVLGVVAGAGTLLLTYRAARRHLGMERWPALVPCLLLAASGPFAAWASGGLETVAFAFFLLMATTAALRCSEDGGSPRDAALAAVAFLLATLTRPEGLLVAAVVAAGIWWRRPARPRLAVALSAALYALALGVYGVWRLTYFGLLFPVTYYAKTGGSVEQVERGATYLGYFALHFVTPLVPLLLLGWWGWRRSAGGSPRARTAASIFGLICAVWSAYVVMVGGDYMAMYRFLVPVLPFVYLICGQATALALATRRTAIPSAVAAALSVAVLGTALHSTPLETRVFDTPPYQHGCFEGIRTERWHVARLSLIGRFFHRYRRSADESLATRAIGAVGFYSGVRVLDLYGLTDPHLALLPPLQGDAETAWAGHQKGDLLYTLSQHPTFVMANRGLKPRPLTLEQCYRKLRRFIRPGTEAQVRRLLASRYRVRYARLRDHENHRSGYFSFLELKDRVADPESVSQQPVGEEDRLALAGLDEVRGGETQGLPPGAR